MRSRAEPQAFANIIYQLEYWKESNICEWRNTKIARTTQHKHIFLSEGIKSMVRYLLSVLFSIFHACPMTVEWVWGYGTALITTIKSVEK